MIEMPINDAGIELLEDFETFVGHAYPDPYSALGKLLRRHGLWNKYLKVPMARAVLAVVDEAMRDASGAPWTFGYGFTDGVEEGDTTTIPEARRRLATSLAADYVTPVLEACVIAPNENELAAMSCLAWNIGVPGFLRSTVLRCHNRGDKLAASRAFGLWNKAGGEESSGLTRRRAAESGLYLKPVMHASAFADIHPAPQVMPQVVEPESSLRKSPIMTTTMALTALTTAAEASRQIDAIRDNLGDLSGLLPFAAVGSVAMGGYVIWHRIKQRSKGWA